MQGYQETPVVELENHPLLVKAGVRLLIKREDLNHPFISGNKWWKLKYNLQEARSLGLRTVLTFGGPYSNHIYATACAAREQGFEAIAVIRGEPPLLTPTLEYARFQGMQLHFVSRADYRNKEDSSFMANLSKTFGEFYLIPEGGTNLLAVRGCAEYATSELAPLPFDQLYLPVGTGGTIAGVIAGLHDDRPIFGVTVLKGAGFLNEKIKDLLLGHHQRSHTNWALLTDFHHGGYARTTPPLLELMKTMSAQYDLPLDHVYTAKTLFAILNRVEEGIIPGGHTVLMLHTGGLQGSVI